MNENKKYYVKGGRRVISMIASLAMMKNAHCSKYLTRKMKSVRFTNQ